MKEFGVKRMGRNPAIKAESNEAVSFFVIFFAVKNTIIVNDAINRFGRILATNSIGRKRLKKAIM